MIDKLFLVLWIVLVLATIVVFNLDTGRVYLFTLLPALPCFIVWRVMSAKRKAFVGDIATRNALSQNFEVLEYDHNKHIEKDLLREIETGAWNVVKEGVDYIRAKHGGAEFQFSNFKLMDIDEKTRGPVFKGQWLILELSEDDWPRLAITDSHPLGGIRRLNRIDYLSENSVFNKRFQILAEDPQMARLLLTPHFVESIMSIDMAANGAARGRKLFYIHQGHAHIVLYTKRKFFEAENLSALQARIEDDIDCIKCVLDVLLMNERLFNE